MKAKFIKSVNEGNTNLININKVDHIIQSASADIYGKEEYLLKCYTKRLIYSWSYKFNEQGKQQRAEDVQKILMLNNA